MFVLFVKRKSHWWTLHHLFCWAAHKSLLSACFSESRYNTIISTARRTDWVSLNNTEILCSEIIILPAAVPSMHYFRPLQIVFPASCCDHCSLQRETRTCRPGWCRCKSTGPVVFIRRLLMKGFTLTLTTKTYYQRQQQQALPRVLRSCSNQVLWI